MTTGLETPSLIPASSQIKPNQAEAKNTAGFAAKHQRANPPTHHPSSIIHHPPFSIPNGSRATTQRNGKIARLPKATRDIINRMLDDGLPYHVIIDELGEAGEGLNTQNLTNWKQGGYQDYLKNQEIIARAKAQMESALDFLRETGDVDAAQVREACLKVATVQLFDVIWRHGDKFLKKSLASDPSKYFTLLNTLCNLSRAEMKLDQFQFQADQAKSSQIKPQ